MSSYNHLKIYEELSGTTPKEYLEKSDGKPEVVDFIGKLCPEGPGTKTTIQLMCDHFNIEGYLHMAWIINKSASLSNRHFNNRKPSKDLIRFIFSMLNTFDIYEDRKVRQL